jgi:non-ribosomal peptide synthase protein (TIGR01720 family)
VPRRGIGYGLLRYLRGDEATAALLGDLPRPEVSFNYLGELGQQLPEAALFSPASEGSGPAQSPAQRRTHLFVITALVAGGRLRVDWGYSESFHRQPSVERLARAFVERLRELIADCRSAGAGSRPGFAEASLAGEDLENLLAELEEAM